nr:hypothetical protein [Tanacetum cinerariifolium]
AARVWDEKEPPNSILTWDDLVNKFVYQFFPPSKTTHLKNEISRFTQRFEETFEKAWDRFKELLRACPHHGFSELTQIDTFYNGLTEQDQDSLNAASGEEILDKNHSNSLGSTAQVQPPVVPISILELDVPRTQTKPTIPYPSSFADTILLMPKFASTIKSLLANKDKLFELAKVLLNENCSAMLLKKLPEKLGDPADRSITRPKGVAEDVFVKVGKFHFPTNFVGVDFEADPRVPLILGRSFLRTGRALIDVYGEELTLRVNNESITLNLNQTMRYSSTYDDTSVNRVDVIDLACDEFVQDVLDFQYNSKSSSPTLVSDDLI